MKLEVSEVFGFTEGQFHSFIDVQPASSLPRCTTCQDHSSSPIAVLPPTLRVVLLQLRSHTPTQEGLEPSPSSHQHCLVVKALRAICRNCQCIDCLSPLCLPVSPPSTSLLQHSCELRFQHAPNAPSSLPMRPSSQSRLLPIQGIVSSFDSECRACCHVPCDQCSCYATAASVTATVEGDTGGSSW